MSHFHVPHSPNEWMTKLTAQELRKAAQEKKADREAYKRVIEEVEQLFELYLKRNSSSPLNIRWETAGEAAHVEDILRGCRNKCIPVNADVRLFEQESSPIAQAAQQRLASFNNATLHFGQDITRQAAYTIPAADVMFIRNLVPTNQQGYSLLSPNAVHVLNHTGVKTRAHSQRRSIIAYGASGRPGLEYEDSGKVNPDALGVGESLKNDGYKLMEVVTDTSQVMRNDGELFEAGKKTTYVSFYAYPPSPVSQHRMDVDGGLAR